MAEAEPDTLAGLLGIFEMRTKADLVAHCAKAVVTGSDLANLILACKCEAIAIRHVGVHQHHHPPELILSDADLRALGENGIGPLSKSAKKTVNKVEAMFEQRRLFNGHMFWMPSYPSDWHLFYFDQKDLGGRHWKSGSHIHLMNMLTHPRLDPNALLATLYGSERPKLGGSLHLRYQP